jgi:hypothetical protein
MLNNGVWRLRVVSIGKEYSLIVLGEEGHLLCHRLLLLRLQRLLMKGIEQMSEDKAVKAGLEYKRGLKQLETWQLTEVLILNFAPTWISEINMN